MLQQEVDDRDSVFAHRKVQRRAIRILAAHERRILFINRSTAARSPATQAQNIAQTSVPRPVDHIKRLVLLKFIGLNHRPIIVARDCRCPSTANKKRLRPTLVSVGRSLIISNVRLIATMRSRSKNGEVGLCCAQPCYRPGPIVIMVLPTVFNRSLICYRGGTALAIAPQIVSVTSPRG